MIPNCKKKSVRVFDSSLKGARPPVRFVVGVGNDVLHHELRLSQFLLQLGQLKVSWGAEKRNGTRTRKKKTSLNTDDTDQRSEVECRYVKHDQH